MKKVRLRLGKSSYEIHIGRGILGGVGSWLKESGFRDRLVIITNPTVKQLYGDNLEQGLTKEGFRTHILVAPDGEAHKSLETAGGLYRELNSVYAERMTPVLALGGGVIGDLAGFVTATYLRGVPLVHLPTTLLAQVDSSIGGKTAVNYDRLKNKIGTFYQPRLVASDTTTLRTLPAREMANGLAEVIKSAVIRDGQFFAYLEANLGRIKARDDKALAETVYRTARIKAGVVTQDERDLGLRNILNYGHTIGHAIETAAGFTIGHGEAVAIGMVAAAKISHRMGILDMNDVNRLVEILKRADLLTGMPDVSREQIIQAMKHDKKITGGKIRFVLSRAIGEVFITDEVSPALVDEVLAELYAET
ncbi:3-dehydroquinate synthase [Chloroflexota bacterium]